MVEWSKCDAVERLPGKLSGQWVVKGTRIGVDAVLANAADGYPPCELVAMFPGLREEDAARIIDFAGKGVDAHTA